MHLHHVSTAPAPAVAVALAVLLSITLVPAAARGEGTPAAEKPYLQQRVPAPAQAFELTVATGYTQGFGTLQPGVSVPQVAQAGVGIDLGVGYRVDRHYSVSFGGSYQELQAERDVATRGFAMTIAVQYHVVPTSPLDPWVELGAGYRFFWIVPVGAAENTLLHGPQLVRVRAGLDVRVSRGLAISPTLGADASMFAFQDNLTTTVISSPTLSTFVFAGIQGRMDFGGLAP